jgi:hypothetical protein
LLSEYAKNIDVIIPRNDEMKLGFPKKPKIVPYGLLHGMGSNPAINIKL